MNHVAKTLARLRTWSLRLGTLGLIVLLGRGGWLALHSIPWFGESAHTQSKGPPHTSRPSSLVTPSAIQGLLTPHAPLPSHFLDPHPSPAPSLNERTLHLYLVVTAAPPRSELRVNGELLGQTPFVGELTCRVGRDLTIVALPPKGMPVRWSRACIGQSVRIE